jgi:hypothetical protein
MIDWPPPTDDSRRARWARFRHPSQSYCGRCGFPWAVVKEHCTPYAAGSSCFPLCESCWKVLGHPEARIPYYATLLEVWEQQSPSTDYSEARRGLTHAVAAGF